MITIEIDPIKVVKEVYNLSVPQGMGFLHYQEGGLSDEGAKRCIISNRISMVYVKGRACKFHANIEGNTVTFADDFWYDHSTAALEMLIQRLNNA